MNGEAHSAERTLTEQQARQLLEQGKLVLISQAWEKFPVSIEYVEKARSAAKRFTEVTGLRSPDAYMIPDGDHRSIDRNTLEWDLAQRGLKNSARQGARTALTEYFNNRHMAHCWVLFSLVDGALMACGARVGHEFEWIRAKDWRHLKLDFARPNMAFADGLTYDLVCVGDPAALDVPSAGAKTPKTEAPPKNRGGAPPRYDWTAFDAEVVRRANTDPDGLPARAELQRQMLEWCDEKWGTEPAISMVRSRLSKLYPE